MKDSFTADPVQHILIRKSSVLPTNTFNPLYHFINKRAHFLLYMLNFHTLRLEDQTPIH